MNFSAGIHPSKTFPSNQDESRRWNSSLQDISIKSGCISPLEFIPPRHFYQIRMNTVAEKLSVPRKHSGSLAPRKLMSQLPPISPGLSFHQKAPASASARKLRIHLCLDGKHDSRKLPDAIIVHAADGNRDGKCVPRPAIQ